MNDLHIYIDMKVNLPLFRALPGQGLAKLVLFSDSCP